LNEFQPGKLWEGGLESLESGDASFYYYTDASGRVAALGNSHPDNSHKILEYYRYRAFGEMITLPVVDDGIEEGSTASDGIEDTPTSLTDNNAYMMSLRGTYGSFVGRRSEEHT